MIFFKQFRFIYMADKNAGLHAEFHMHVYQFSTLHVTDVRLTFATDVMLTRVMIDIIEFSIITSVTCISCKVNLLLVGSKKTQNYFLVCNYEYLPFNNYWLHIYISQECRTTKRMWFWTTPPYCDWCQSSRPFASYSLQFSMNCLWNMLCE